MPERAGGAAPGGGLDERLEILRGRGAAQRLGVQLAGQALAERVRGLRSMAHLAGSLLGLLRRVPAAAIGGAGGGTLLRLVLAAATALFTAWAGRRGDGGRGAYALRAARGAFGTAWPLLAVGLIRLLRRVLRRRAARGGQA